MIVQNLLYCYAISIKKIFSEWNHNYVYKHIDEEHTQTKKKYIKKHLKIVKVPLDNDRSKIIFKRKDKLPFSDLEFKEFSEKCYKVEDLCVESFNKFVKKTNGKWFNVINGIPDYRKLVNLEKSLTLHKNKKSIYYIIKNQPASPCSPDYWIPLDLYKFYKNDSIYLNHAVHKYEEYRIFLNQKYENMRKGIFENCTVREIVYIDDTLNEIYQELSLDFDGYVNKKISEKEYTECVDYVISDIKEKGYKVEIYERLSGKKRKRGSPNTWV